jgi:hypothetical protein
MRQRGLRSAPERYDFWARASMYASLAVLSAPALFAAAGGLVRPAGLAAFVLLAAAQAAITIALLRASLSHSLARGPKPKPGLVAAGLAVTAAGLLAGAAVFPDFNQPAAGGLPASMWVALIFAGSGAGAQLPEPLRAAPAALCLH